MNIFHRSNRVSLVKQLEARRAEIAEHLEWDGSPELEAEARIILAALIAIKKEHAPRYFDALTFGDL